jgi:RNA polymerase sigma-70 factor (ECF subfamily)
VATVAQEPGLTPLSAALSESRTESELMSLVAGGDHDAFLVVYDRNATAALGVALGMLRSREAAEEIVQEAFLSLWRGAGSYNPARGSVRTFVLGITRYRALDAIRRQAVRTRQSASDDGLAESREAPGRTDAEAARREEAASIWAALSKLPQGQSRAIELAFFAGLSHTEIATQLGMPIGTVKGRIRLGIDKLRYELRNMTDTTYTTTIEISPTPARNT